MTCNEVSIFWCRLPIVVTSFDVALAAAAAAGGGGGAADAAKPHVNNLNEC